MNWDLKTEIGCSAAEMASEWDSGKEAGEFVLAAGCSKELGRREHGRNPILAFPEAKVLVHRDSRLWPHWEAAEDFDFDPVGVQELGDDLEGEFVLVAGCSKELGRREHCRNPILVFPEVKALVHRGSRL